MRMLRSTDEDFTPHFTKKEYENGDNYIVFNKNPLLVIDYINGKLYTYKKNNDA